MAAEWDRRQTVLAVLVAVVIGMFGGGSIYAASDGQDDSGGPGGFGPHGPPPRSQSR
ncbi:hypothetical protein [Mycolicibacterium sp. P9-22]|uniref:hypothetical protein n=1 Tax=Mycolicibacterium sp. P9-22 TaxID=2024613 RepID=UPI0018838B03|nr:hypothetical protein [Mycolicibacterium sp. P9-22]